MVDTVMHAAMHDTVMHATVTDTVMHVAMHDTVMCQHVTAVVADPQSNWPIASTTAHAAA